MTNEMYYIKLTTIQKRDVICSKYECDKCPINFMNKWETDENGDLYVANSGCLDGEAFEAWLKEEHNYDSI